MLYNNHKHKTTECEWVTVLFLVPAHPGSSWTHPGCPGHRAVKCAVAVVMQRRMCEILTRRRASMRDWAWWVTTWLIIGSSPRDSSADFNTHHTISLTQHQTSIQQVTSLQQGNQDSRLCPVTPRGSECNRLPLHCGSKQCTMPIQRTRRMNALASTRGDKTVCRCKHPQNWKYITYCIVVEGGPSRDHR